jgi:biopolymer transport protein ExbB/TolQ
MDSAQQPAAPERAVKPRRRPRANLSAFVIGLPLATSVLCLFHFGPWRQTPFAHYVQYPVEQAEVVMFCCAVGALTAKFWNFWTERRACNLELLPAWDGQPVPAGEAARLWAGFLQLPRRWQQTMVVRRVSAALDFLRSRGSAADFDDHLRALADADAVALESSYGLTRFITWAIPILGFLGTVLGITTAISGVTPDKLENSLSEVTDGLAEAFDATALALALTMVTMFLSFLVERAEQSVLDLVDRYAEQDLAHRFERTGAEGGQFVEVVRRHTEVLCQAMEKLMQRQTALWAQTIEEADRRRRESEQRQQAMVAAALEAAIEKTLDTHARRLSALEKQAVEQGAGLAEKLTALAATIHSTGREQQAGLAQVTQAVSTQVEALARLQEGDKHLRRLQETLNQNLAALAGAGTFEQALLSLTGAIHLLTARSAATPAGTTRLGPKSGAAA